MYQASDSRYEKMVYNRVGKSGLLLPAISLGLWHNFGDVDALSNQRGILRRAFDLGITYFDLANNYGRPNPGSAEKNFGKIFKEDLKPYRDEMIISTKAGYNMWEGPYGEWGSRKNLIASCDQSLKRMGLDYVDLFYSHRPDPNTPFEETALALEQIVRSGKALYIGISNYNAKQTKEMGALLKDLKVPFVIHQPNYNLFDRWIEDGLTEELKVQGKGAVVYSPLAQGLLTDRYLKGIPEDSRAHRPNTFLSEDQVEKTLEKVKQLNEIAQNRGQSLAQMSLAWNLQNEVVASVLVGASRVSQLEDNVKALDNLEFSKEELAKIEAILK